MCSGFGTGGGFWHEKSAPGDALFKISVAEMQKGDIGEHCAVLAAYAVRAVATFLLPPEKQALLYLAFPLSVPPNPSVSLGEPVPLQVPFPWSAQETAL